MNILLRTYKITNINVKKIDSDIFYESLLASIIKIKDECRRLDRKITSVALAPYLPGMTTIEHFDTLIDLSNIKVKLINLYKEFFVWFGKLNDKQRKFYMNYFIKKEYRSSDGMVLNRVREKIVLPMIKSFRYHIKTETDIHELDLIKYPFIHSLYVNTYNSIRRKPRKNRGEHINDRSTDERCY